jgi:hypothetical protein
MPAGRAAASRRGNRAMRPEQIHEIRQQEIFAVRLFEDYLHYRGGDVVGLPSSQALALINASPAKAKLVAKTGVLQS